MGQVPYPWPIFSCDFFQLLVFSYNNPLIGLHFRAVETWLLAERDRRIAHLVKQKETVSSSKAVMTFREARSL
jgi:hypothetical protein